MSEIRKVFQRIQPALTEPDNVHFPDEAGQCLAVAVLALGSTRQPLSTHFRNIEPTFLQSGLLLGDALTVGDMQAVKSLGYGGSAKYHIPSPTVLQNVLEDQRGFALEMLAINGDWDGLCHRSTGCFAGYLTPDGVDVPNHVIAILPQSTLSRTTRLRAENENLFPVVDSSCKPPIVLATAEAIFDYIGSRVDGDFPQIGFIAPVLRPRKYD